MTIPENAEEFLADVLDDGKITIAVIVREHLGIKKGDRVRAWVQKVKEA